MNPCYNFSDALTLLKEGYKMARHGWNAKYMYVAYQKGYPDGIAINKNTADATGLKEGTVCRFAPYLILKTTDDIFMPWSPNQRDLLEEDWYMV